MLTDKKKPIGRQDGISVPRMYMVRVVRARIYMTHTMLPHFNAAPPYKYNII